MFVRRRGRVLLFGALALLAALVPAGLAVGSHDGDTTFGDTSVVYLTLGSTDRISWEGVNQSITIRNNCSVVLGSNADLLDIIPTGGQLGGARDGLGVKSGGDGSGEPCGRVEAADGEAITVSLGSDLDGFLMQAIDVDLELKFNAVVDVIFKHDGVTVHTVQDFSGTGGSDDGPDSGDGDNFRFIYPGDGDDPISFDQVIFDPEAGAVSLEGGADGTDAGTIDDSNNSSQFQIAQAFDGDITCGDAESETIDDSNVPEVVGVVTMEALNLGSDWDAECTDRKPFTEGVTSSSLTFIPVGDGDARYTMILTIKDQPITTEDGGQTTSLVMEYNDGTVGSGDRTLQPCLKTPQDSDFVFDGNNGLLPSGETACYYGVSLTPTAPGLGDEEWKIYFEDDPNFSFR